MSKEPHIQLKYESDEPYTRNLTKCSKGEVVGVKRALCKVKPDSQRSPIHNQKSPIYSQKSPIYSHIQSKETYVRSKEPYIRSN